MEYYLAQVNIGRTVAPMDSPVMAEFVANLDRINTLAENSEGFVWRLKDDSNNATTIRMYDDDDMLIVNMSVWKNLDSLFHYVYRTDHLEIFKKRASWFEKMTDMHMALWYVPAGHVPDVKEAATRLDHLRKHGDTPFAFSFRKKFTPKDAEAYNLTAG